MECEGQEFILFLDLDSDGDDYESDAIAVGRILADRPQN